MTKQELIYCIKGVAKGSYEQAEYLNQKGLGDLTGFPNESFRWTDKLYSLSEQELADLYKELQTWDDSKRPILKTPKISWDRVLELQRMYFERTGVWLPVNMEDIDNHSDYSHRNTEL